MNVSYIYNQHEAIIFCQSYTTILEFKKENPGYSFYDCTSIILNNNTGFVFVVYPIHTVYSFTEYWDFFLDIIVLHTIILGCFFIFCQLHTTILECGCRRIEWRKVEWRRIGCRRIEWGEQGEGEELYTTIIIHNYSRI